MKYVRLAAVSVAILPWLLSGAEGCSCAQGGTVCGDYASAAAVFVGVVSDITRGSIRRDETSKEDLFFGKIVHFSVEQAYKGVESPEISVETGNGGGDCGYPFESGKRYLVYAYGIPKGKLGTGICSRTKPLSQASEDLDYIRGLPESASKSRVSGTLIRHTDDRDANGFRKTKPMSETKIVIIGDGHQFEAFTNEQGVYVVTGLPAGKYRVKPVLSSNLRLERWDNRDSDEIVVPPGGCVAADLTVETNGRITGTIFDSSGNPAVGIQVDLVPVQFVGTTPSAEVVESKNEKTDKEGRYQFTGVSPGRYYLGVNLRYPPTANLPYPGIYYSGTQEREKATIVELREGEKLSGYDLFLSPPISLRTIEGVFLWSNGLPVKEGFIYFEDSAEATHTNRVYSSGRVDDQGRFSIKAFDGLECWVHANTRSSTGARMESIEIEPVKIVVNASTPRLKLIAPLPGDRSGKK
ncbi:MAG: hypothetical protein C5B54_03395 [Acidobacteria bacterium]|nr:MAG: hypothetical protein C5B54_03395 [Acidobacteriota bacterium]